MTQKRGCGPSFWSRYETGSARGSDGGAPRESRRDVAGPTVGTEPRLPSPHVQTDAGAGRVSVRIRVHGTGEERTVATKREGDSSDTPDVKLVNPDIDTLPLATDSSALADPHTRGRTVGVDDLIQLTHLHEPAILHVLCLRYSYNLIYTFTGSSPDTHSPLASPTDSPSPSRPHSPTLRRRPHLAGGEPVPEAPGALRPGPA